jgi:hypothetical protein
MATVKTYVTQLQNRQIVIARKFGCDIAQADKQTRVLNLSVLALLAVVIKTLVDKGVITDAELLATLDAARDDTYPDEPMEPPPEEP